jgi:hypothetical protein
MPRAGSQQFARVEAQVGLGEGLENFVKSRDDGAVARYEERAVGFKAAGTRRAREVWGAYTGSLRPGCHTGFA